MRIPRHIGIIPDGNRRWAESKGMTKDKGYALGVNPGLLLFKLCKQYGVKELTFYGFTTDNAKRPKAQKTAFVAACIESVKLLANEDCEILVIGNSSSPVFPNELLPYTSRKVCGKGGIKVNFLINYGWEWDLNSLKAADINKRNLSKELKSNDISRIDLIIRWGGRRRLSGFLPVQSVYSDFYIIDDLWPDFKPKHLQEALKWYNVQDVTLGG